MQVFVFAAVVAKHGNLVGDLVILRRDRPAISIAREILGWIKAKRGMLGEGAGPLALPFGAMRLGTILDDPEAMIGRQLFHGIDVGRPAIQMNRQDSDGALGDAVL